MYIYEVFEISALPPYTIVILLYLYNLQKFQTGKKRLAYFLTIIYYFFSSIF